MSFLSLLSLFAAPVACVVMGSLVAVAARRNNPLGPHLPHLPPR